MSYKLNNIPLTNHGIAPRRVSGSNIALSGHLDMPPRIGKTFHDWTGKPGIEPYVLASEIRHGGRKIDFGGYLVAENKANAQAMLNNFYEEIGSYTDLVNLDTPWGTHQVYIKENVAGNYLQHGWVEIQIKMQEPAPLPPEGGVPVGAETGKVNIDGVALEDLGMFIVAVKDHLNRPQTKEARFTAYQNEGYQVTPPEALEFELELIAYADTYAALKANIEGLHKLLAAPGMRSLNIGGTSREVFNIKGFSVTNIKVSPPLGDGGLCLCRISIPLMQGEVGEPFVLGNLLDNAYNQIVSNLEKLIKVKAP